MQGGNRGRLTRFPIFVERLSERENRETSETSPIFCARLEMQVSRLLLLSLYVIMTAAVYRVTSEWLDRYELDTFVNQLHLNLYQARVQAMDESRPIEFAIEFRRYGTLDREVLVPPGVLVPNGILITFFADGRATEASLLIRTPRWRKTIEISMLGIITVGEPERH